MYTKLRMLYVLCIVYFCHSLSAAQEMWSMPSPHASPAERGLLGSLTRYYCKSSPVVRWAMLGIDLELENNPDLLSYIRDYDICMQTIKDYYSGSHMLNMHDPIAGNQELKLNSRCAFIVNCRESALEAFKQFELDAKRDTAKRAALFLRASQLLSQKNNDFVPPVIQKALTSERKAIRPKLRSYLVDFGHQELIDLASQGYEPDCLYDSDDQADSEIELAHRLKSLMTIEAHDEAQEDEYDHGPEEFYHREIAHL